MMLWLIVSIVLLSDNYQLARINNTDRNCRVQGTVLAFCGLYVYLEFAAMFPRSGGEKVYLEAVYRRPKLLITTLFGINAVVLGFTASGEFDKDELNVHVKLKTFSL